MSENHGYADAVVKSVKNVDVPIQGVVHPNHYGHGIECIEYINSHNMNFNLGNIVKYATRAPFKGSYIGDLSKVIQYAKFEIDRVQAECK
jgi:hypothetical protein